MGKQSNKRHLLFLSPGFPGSESETDCIPALQLFLKNLNETGLFKISIISLHYPYQRAEYLWHGISVNAFAGKNKKTIKRLLIYKQIIKKARKINSRDPIDHVHSFWLGECSKLGNKIAKDFKIPHSCTLMGQDALQSNRYLKRIKPLPKLICLSEFHQAALKKSLGKEADLLIGWGIEREMANSKAKEIDIIGVGWLNKVKRFHRFIDIIGELKKTFPDIKAEIVGAGEAKEDLQRQIKKGELSENIKLTGGLNREETLLRMEKAKILLHTSDYESFGMVLIEALAKGLKVFSTPVGIAPELEEIISYHTTEELLNHVSEFLESGEEVRANVPLDIKATVDSYINNVFLS